MTISTENESTSIKLGYGDIFFCIMKVEATSDRYILFHNVEAGEIGEPEVIGRVPPHNKGELLDTSSLLPKVTMEFDDVRSLDGLIETLSLLREKKFGRKSVELSASEAVYGVMGYLTSQDKDLVFSSSRYAGHGANIAQAFCKANNLADPGDDWSDRLKHPVGLEFTVENAEICECEGE